MGQMGGGWPQAGGGAAGHGHCTCPSAHANCKACMHGLAAHLIAGAFGYCYSCNGQLPTATANQEASGPAYNANAGNQGSAWAPQERHWGTSQSTYGVQPRGNVPGSAEEGTGAPHFGNMPNGETPLVSEELVAIFAAGKQRTHFSLWVTQCSGSDGLGRASGERGSEEARPAHRCRRGGRVRRQRAPKS